MSEQKTAIIIGAGPAGLTAAFELLKRTKIKPIIFEFLPQVGGISRTIKYKGNSLDIGPHRFFSKSERVLDLWEEVLPLQGALSKDDILLGRQIPLSKKPNASDPEKTDCSMLYRERLTRIYFLKKFFDYPISLSPRTIRNLGLWRLMKIGFSYVWRMIFPIKQEKNLEDFYINRFGQELYSTFFEDYTRKVWGIPCREIPKDWGAQRVKGLSITKAIFHAIKNIFAGSSRGLSKTGETSLVESFLYPKLGAGQIYEQMAEQIKVKGGEMLLEQQIVGIVEEKGQIVGVKVRDLRNNEEKIYRGDYFFSTMPIKELIASFATVPENVKTAAEGLAYRDFLTVGLLYRRMAKKNDTPVKTLGEYIPDDWIYIQDREATMGRLDIFNNFSPYILENQKNVWLGSEYFCNVGDDLWKRSDQEMAQFAAKELAAMGLADVNDLLDSVVVRQPKAYPAYFGSYDRLPEIVSYLNGFSNLFLIGRNGMHKYNNMDHSILTAMVAVDNIVAGITTKENIWAVNTEEEYHETKK